MDKQVLRILGGLMANQAAIMSALSTLLRTQDKRLEADQLIRQCSAALDWIKIIKTLCDIPTEESEWTRSPNMDEKPE